MEDICISDDTQDAEGDMRLIPYRSGPYFSLAVLQILEDFSFRQRSSKATAQTLDGSWVARSYMYTEQQKQPKPPSTCFLHISIRVIFRENLIERDCMIKTLSGNHSYANSSPKIIHRV